MANTPNSTRRTDDRSGASATEHKPRHDESGSMMDKARDAASSVAEKTRETASSVIDRTRDAASSVAHGASEMASNVGQKAQDATTAVAGSMKSLAGSIREHAPASGMMKTATTSVADSLESGGRYLEAEGLSGMGEDLTNLVRRNPIPAFFVGIAVGFLVARAARS